MKILALNVQKRILSKMIKKNNLYLKKVMEPFLFSKFLTCIYMTIFTLLNINNNILSVMSDAICNKILF